MKVEHKKIMSIFGLIKLTIEDLHSYKLLAMAMVAPL